MRSASLTLPEWEYSHPSPLVSMGDALEKARKSGEEPNINTVYLPLEYKLIITIITIAKSVRAMEHQILHP